MASMVKYKTEPQPSRFQRVRFIAVSTTTPEHSVSTPPMIGTGRLSKN
jgi:hypothetical protein